MQKERKSYKKDMIKKVKAPLKKGFNIGKLI
jgi:hypothetical protein